MNTTTITPEGNSYSYQYATFIFSGLFVVSEIIPFVKKLGGEKSGGLVHILVCFLKGSACVAGTVANTLENMENK